MSSSWLPSASQYYKPSSGAEWLEIFDEWAQSGKSQQTFCQDKNIRYRTFISRRTKLLKKSNKPNPALAPVKVINSEPQSITTSTLLIRLELPSGIKLFIPSTANEAIVSTIISSVGKLKC